MDKIIYLIWKSNSFSFMGALIEELVVSQIIPMVEMVVIAVVLVWVIIIALIVESR